MNTLKPFLCLLFILSASFYAQNKLIAQNEITETETKELPVFLDFYASSRGFGAQAIYKRALASSNRLGVFSMNMFHATWKNTGNYDREALSQTYLTFDIVKGFSANIGYHFSSIDRMRPSFSLMYAYRSTDWFIMLMPRVDISENPNVEGLALLQYTPQFTKNWRFYIRAELLASRNFALKEHTRTFGMFFLGLRRGDFTFGPFANWDMYGKYKEEYFGAGGFLQILLH